ncbi:unnamed protein product [Bursaphelenchus okinawaensis]|uniref:Uncharacterized protein n=1 Tax=Bursaphelenchus okinawaensis TaxID=465554 RepID=A0A811LDD6_9BILA|nr:unnamed protein product [Bursaphelenchus okinawaensis]CAG9121096.1 unnamed protein product [Bursaphelenchus okinawaensis]
MWFARLLASGPVAQRYVRLLTLPIAIVVGTIGYAIESRVSTPKKIDYLEESVVDRRLRRQLGISEGDITLDRQKLAPETLKINRS